MQLWEKILCLRTTFRKNYRNILIENAFTRDGSFQLDRAGNLVNTDGCPSGLGQTPINIPLLRSRKCNPELLSEISVNSEGEISATYGLDNMLKLDK